MDYNFNYLHCFSVLSKTLSFSKAAKELSIAQPAVSRSIKNFEEQLGVDLFYRTNKKVSLTPHGKKLMIEIGGTLESINKSLKGIVKESNEVNGHIRVGAMPEDGRYHIAPLLSEFSKKYPGITYNLSLESNSKIDRNLNLGELDFIFGLTQYTCEGKRSYKISDQKSFLVTSLKSDSFIVGKISDCNFVGYREDDPLLRVYFKEHYPKSSYNNANIKYVINDHLSLIELIKKKKNLYAVLPENSLPVAKALKKGSIKIVKDKSIKSTTYLTLNEMNQYSTLHKEFIKFVIEKH
jgi:DNA-binding transcriptional LysR family regulator